MKININCREDSMPCAENFVNIMKSAENTHEFHKKLREYCANMGRSVEDVMNELLHACCMFEFDLDDRVINLLFCDDFCLSQKKSGPYVAWTTSFKDTDFCRSWKGILIGKDTLKGAFSQAYTIYMGALQTELMLQEQKTHKKRTVYRYMSDNEFRKLMNGDVLVNETDHSKSRHTHSVGFCFLQDLSLVEGGRSKEWFTPATAILMLRTIVSEDVLVKFETEEVFRFSYGQYASPFERGGDLFNPELVYMRELSLTRYSKDTVRPIEFCRGEVNCRGTMYSGKWETIDR